MISQESRLTVGEVAALLKTAATIASPGASIDDSLASALDLVCAFTGWPLGHVFLLDPDGEQLHSTDIWHNEDPHGFSAFVAATRAMTLPAGVGLPGRIVSNRSPAWIMDVRTDSNFPRAAAAFEAGIGAGIGFPITSSIGTEGVLEFFTRQALSPDEPLLDLLSHVGHELGNVLDRARTEQVLSTVGRRLLDAEHLARIGPWHYEAAADVMTWSPELCDLHGLDRKLAPTSFSEYLARIHPEDVVSVRTAIEHTVQTNEPLDIEYRMVLPTNEIRWAHARGEAFTRQPDHVLELQGYCQDVTDQMRSHEELLLSERRLADAQRLAHLGSWNLDLTSGTITWSAELFRIYGVDEDSSPASVEQYLERVHPDDQERVQAAVQRTIETLDPFEHDYRIVRPSGEVRRVHARGEVAEVVGGVATRLAGYCHDVTERTLMEERLREAAENERQVAESLRGIEQTKNALLLAVSHEIRTPLAVIVGIAHTLQKINAENELATELLGRLRANCQRLEGSLSDLLDVDRLSRGVVEPRPRPTNLAKLVHRVLEGLPPDRAVEVDVGELVAVVDPALVERIVETLVSTAFRFTKPGVPVSIGACSTADGTLIKVDYSGDNVPDDVKGQIFEPFQQGMSLAHNPRAGVGLNLVAGFAQLHGGQAWVEDRPGGGACFRVLLPDPPTIA